MGLLRRKRWDPQPEGRCAVLLASDGRQRFTDRAVARAADLADGDPVAVVTIARIYGTQFGIPHPGLLPTKAELAERRDWVGAAIKGLRTRGVAADGQVAATRKATKKLAQVARVRGVSVVVIDETPRTGLRRLVEGDVGTELKRKLRRFGIDVEVVPASR